DVPGLRRTLPEQARDACPADDLDIGPVAVLEGTLVRQEIRAQMAREVQQPRVAVAGQRAGERLEHVAPEPRRDEAVVAVEIPVEIPAISTEQLVAADPGENDGHVLAGEL